MYYLLVAVLALLIFLLFIKALGAVLKGIITFAFVIAVLACIGIFIKSMNGPVDLFGLYRVDKFEVTKISQE